MYCRNYVTANDGCPVEVMVHNSVSCNTAVASYLISILIYVSLNRASAQQFGIPRSL